MLRPADQCQLYTEPSLISINDDQTSNDLRSLYSTVGICSSVFARGSAEENFDEEDKVLLGIVLETEDGCRRRINCMVRNSHLRASGRTELPRNGNG